MAVNNYDGFLKYKQDNGDIAVLYPKTKVANVEGAATSASVTALTGRVDTIDTRLDDLEANQGTADSNITKLTEDVTQAKKDIAANTEAITNEVSDRKAADTALDTRVKTLESGAHNPPQLYVSAIEPEALKARDWWFDTSAT